MTAQHVQTITATADRRPLDRASTRLLFATDDREAARAAEEWIRRLRWAQAPTVDVLTVARRASLASGLWLQTYRPAVREAVHESRKADLRAAQQTANLVASRLQLAGTLVRVWARHGDPADEIVATARLESPDLVVVGYGGRSNRTLLGRPNLASQIGPETGTPVLVACRPSPGDGSLPQRVVVLVPKLDAGARALRWLGKAGWLTDVDLTVASLGTMKGDRSRGSLVASPTERSSDVNDLAPLVAAAKETASVRIARLRDTKRRVRMLLELIDRTRADLVVVPLLRSRDADEFVAAIAGEARTTVLLIPSPSGLAQP